MLKLAQYVWITVWTLDIFYIYFVWIFLTMHKKIPALHRTDTACRTTFVQHIQQAKTYSTSEKFFPLTIFYLSRHWSCHYFCQLTCRKKIIFLLSKPICWTTTKEYLLEREGERLERERKEGACKNIKRRKEYVLIYWLAGKLIICTGNFKRGRGHTHGVAWVVVTY